MNLDARVPAGPLEEKWGIVSTVEFAPEPKPAASGTGARR